MLSTLFIVCGAFGMTRFNRIIVIILSCLVIVPGFLWFFFQGHAAPEQKVEVFSQSIVFDPRAPERRQYGRLIWRGGLVLTSSNERFGGISGITIDRQGRKITGVIDTGSWITAELVYDGDKLEQLDNVYIGQLSGRNKKPFLLPRDQDAEALVRKGDQYLISFERNHRIGVFSSINGRPSHQVGNVVLPDDSKAMASNKGLESLDIIRGGPLKGSLLVFSEALLNSSEYIKGWIIGEKGADNIYLKAMDGFSITEVESLEDGSLIFLERKYRPAEGVSMRIRFVKSSDVKAGAKLDGEVLLKVGPEFSIDNMEGLAVHKNNQGQTIITLISDDNFSTKQRTLILQFELAQKAL